MGPSAIRGNLDVIKQLGSFGDRIVDQLDQGLSDVSSFGQLGA